MTNSKTIFPELTFVPLTKERWSDFETLFGVRGACGGCWCMFWRLTRSEFERQVLPVQNLNAKRVKKINWP
jgi:hypothetical protein